MTANGKPTLEHARECTRAGILVCAVRLDGSKRPAHEGWQNRALLSEDELQRLFGNAQYGIGTVGGKPSGNLEIIDFDINAHELFPQWRELVEAQQPGLVAKLNIVQTPREPPGFHVRYRCLELDIPGNTKLAMEPLVDEQGEVVLDDKGKPKFLTLIETRGTGGQAIAPGSPLAVHPSCRPYVHIDGPPLTALAKLTAAEREILIASARSFDLTPQKTTRKTTSTNASHAVGDDFDRRGPDWAEILVGWECVRKRADVRHWRRPDKDGLCWSATTGYCKGKKDGADLLHVFSSNAHPFEMGESYGKFRANVLLNHNGDFTVAARALRQLGYGSETDNHSRNGSLNTDSARDNPIHLTDQGNAIRLVEKYGADLRHVWPWTKWLVWDGKRWRRDDSGAIVRCAKGTIADLFAWATGKIKEIERALKEMGYDGND
jgi:hypothetical protein